MPHHAGYAAALTIRGQTIQDLQRIGYHAGTVPHDLTGSAQGVSADLFLGLPHLEFHDGDDGQVRVVLRAWGPLSVTPDGLPTETRQVVVDVAALAQPRIGLEVPDDPDAAPKLTLALGGSLPPVQSLRVTSFAGGTFSPAAQAVLASDNFRLGVSVLIGQRLSGMTPNGLDAGFLGGIARAEGTTITPVVRDGALCIGIDVFAAEVNGEEVTTFGDPAALVDFAGADDIAISINSVAAALAFDSVQHTIADRVAKDGADLDSFHFAVEDGRFVISGEASSGEGSATFFMHAVPNLTRPGYTHEYDELWFDMQDIDVDVDASWWADLLAFATFGIGGLVVIGLMAGMKQQSVTADFARSSLQRQAARVREFTLEGTTEPLIRLTLDSFDCFADEVLILSTLRPQFPAPDVGGPYGVPVEEAVAARSLDFPLLMPYDALPDDPQLNVRWTVRRKDTGEEVFVADRQAETMQILRISNDFVPFLAAPEFGIECRVYRTLGADVEEVFSDLRTLRIVDPVDRSHPYVHWTHEVWAPEVQLHANGSRELLGFAAKGRRSKLHRTDIPGRCRSVSKFSLNQIRDPGPGVTPSAIQYLDALPFPVEDLVASRKQVCDYCFFGGPTKTVPLIT